MDETRAVNLRRLTKAEFAEFIAGHERYVYVGHDLTVHGVKLKASPWQAPQFSSKAIEDTCKTRKCGVQEALKIAAEEYKGVLRANGKLIKTLPTLQGKILVCWWEQQGNALIELLKELT